MSDAFVTVECDGCEPGEATAVDIQLTALARSGSYDTRNVDAELRQQGWEIAGEDEHYCEDCQRLRAGLSVSEWLERK